MAKGTITTTTGQELPQDMPNGNWGELVTAMAARNPAYLIEQPDGRRTVLNTQNILSVEYTPDEDPAVKADREAREQAEADRKAAEDAAAEQAPSEDTRTVTELKEALDGAGVEYDSKARKDDLLKLAQDNRL